MNDLQKRTWAEVSLNNIEHNYRRIRSSLPEGTKFLGMSRPMPMATGLSRWQSVSKNAARIILP